MAAFIELAPLVRDCSDGAWRCSSADVIEVLLLPHYGSITSARAMGKSFSEFPRRKYSPIEFLPPRNRPARTECSWRHDRVASTSELATFLSARPRRWDSAK